MLSIYRNQVEPSLSSCDFAIGSRRKGKTEKFAKVRQILLLCNGRERSFHMSEK